MAKLSFSATIEEWAEKIPEAEEAVRNESAQEVVEIMTTPVSKGGRMRVDTGFLRASLVASTSMMPQINPAARPAESARPASYSFDVAQIEALIAGASLEDTLFFGFTAAYAAIREYKGDAFVRTAVQRWPQIVEVNAQRVKAAFDL